MTVQSNRKKNKLGIICSIFTMLLQGSLVNAQEGWKTIHHDQLKEAIVVNRSARFAEGVYLDKRAGDGFLQIKGLAFQNGTIEADIKGSNTPQQSFVGIAFHGQDSLTYDVVYFRPFNFNNPERKSHSVQYISHPAYTWDRLRSESPGKYESVLNENVDPNTWFHVRIEINFPQVRVYVNDQSEPTLLVDQLSTGKPGWLGFWVGNTADGQFKNLRIRSAAN